MNQNNTILTATTIKKISSISKTMACTKQSAHQSRGGESTTHSFGDKSSKWLCESHCWCQKTLPLPPWDGGFIRDLLVPKENQTVDEEGSLPAPSQEDFAKWVTKIFRIPEHFNVGSPGGSRGISYWPLWVDNCCALHAKHATIMPKDSQLARRIQGVLRE